MGLMKFFKKSSIYNIRAAYFQQSIIYMAYFKNLLILLQFLTIVFCSLGTVNPSYYIWLDYGALVPLLIKNTGKYSAGIPCLARIGKCTCTYSLMPLGWQASNTGQITIPVSDAIKTGSFALRGICKEPTGQVLNINLVARIQNMFLSVIDSSNFYKNNGYNYASSQSKPTQYQTSVLVKSVPDGFLTLQLLQQQINSQQIGNITSIINEIIFKYAPCRSKINYLTSVKDLLAKTVRNNNDVTAQRQNSINTLEKILSNLKNTRAQSLKKNGIQAQIDQLKKNIQKTNTQLLQTNLDLLNFKRLKQTSQNDMNNYRIEQSKLQNNTTISYQKQINVLNKDLQEYFNTILNTNRTILSVSLQKQLYALPLITKQLQDAFAKNIQQFVKSQIDLKNVNNRLNDIYYLQSQTNSFVAAIDKKILQLKQKTSQNYDKVTVQAKINQILVDNRKIAQTADYIQIMKRYVGMTCFN